MKCVDNLHNIQIEQISHILLIIYHKLISIKEYNFTIENKNTFNTIHKNKSIKLEKIH